MAKQKNRSRGGGGKGVRRLHQQAWAPYNFVPLPDKPLYADLAQHDNNENRIPHRHDAYGANRHTGYFNVTLTTETPLFVRGMLTIGEQEVDENATRKNSAAFSLDGQQPVIPGSSLRGMLRTLVEIATFGKMHFVSDAQKMFFRAVAADKSDPLKYPYQQVIGSFSKNVKAGYLVKDGGKWSVHPAKKLGKAAFGKVKDKNRDGSVPVEGVQGLTRFNQRGYKVQYHPVCYEAQEDRVFHVYTPDEGQDPMGMLVCTGNMSETQEEGRINSPRKNYAVVANPNPNARLIPIPGQTIQDYIEGRSAFQKEEPFDSHLGVLKVGRPVFYIEEAGQVIHFGHTPNFRIAPLIYDDYIARAVTPKDRVPFDLRKEYDQLDYAEAMFGYVSGIGEQRVPTAYASRISVTSATVRPEQHDFYDREIVPRILASPKPTTFQHYLEQPEGVDTPTHQLRHYGDDTNIRGHKLYWRQMINSLKSVEEPEKDKDPDTSTQHTVIKPVRSGIRFTFRVYFENLSDQELGALIWVLNLGHEPDARHQLGMGKPFGLGVVKLEPQLIQTNRLERYRSLFDANGHWTTGESETSSEQQDNLVMAFKTRVGDFDNQVRIRELMALVRTQAPDDTKFSYMQIENARDENDYQGRPVLPYPREVSG